MMTIEEAVEALFYIQFNGWIGNQRFAADQALQALGRADDALISKMRQVEAALKPVQEAAERRLLAMGRRNPLVVDVLMRQLDSDDPLPRYYASSLLGRIGPKAAKAIPRLIAIFADVNQPENVRRMACAALRMIGLASFDLLMKFAQGDDVYMRIAATDELSRFRFTPAGQRAIPVLIRGLADPEPRVRSCAIEGLTTFGKKAIAALEKATRSANDTVAVLAAATIVEISRGKGAALAPVLRRGLTHPDNLVRRAAAEALTEARRGALPALADLIKTLGDADVWVRKYAAEAIGGLGAAAEDAVTPLVKALDAFQMTTEDERFFVNHLVRALGKIGRQPELVASALTRFLERAPRDVLHEEPRALAEDALDHFRRINARRGNSTSNR